MVPVAVPITVRSAPAANTFSATALASPAASEDAVGSAVTAGPDAVDTPIGRLATAGHTLAEGAPVRLLVRPEKIAPVRVNPAADAPGENNFAVRVLHDRFFGASREIELSVGQGQLKIDTASREDITHVHVPRDAVQFLPTP